MLNSITTLRSKIRALVTDAIKTEPETFTYTNSDTFTLAEENIESIVQVTKNGEVLGSGEYSFDSATNEITITPATGDSLTNGDIIIVKYTYYKYSNTELDEYIKASLVWMSVYDATEKDFEVESNEIFPTPDGRTLDLICLVASILIQPNWSQYALPNLRVVYPRKWSKEEKIERLVNKFVSGIGVLTIIQWNELL